MGLLDRLSGEPAHRRAYAASQPKPHSYESCDDWRCKRVPCVAYKKGREAGREVGYREGYAAGRAGLVRSATSPQMRSGASFRGPT